MSTEPSPAEGQTAVAPALSLGRIVHYVADADDVARLRRQRGDGPDVRLSVGDVLPAIVVGRHSGTCANLHVFGDGDFTFWVGPAVCSEPDDPNLRPGYWHWPARNEIHEAPGEPTAESAVSLQTSPGAPDVAEDAADAGTLEPPA